MNLSWKAPLGAGQIACPVLHVEKVLLSLGIPQADDETLGRIFPGTNHQLKTWGRTAGTRAHDPHWIGVRGPTPLHRDPAYPRYSHHLVLRSDDLWVRGLDLRETHIRRGTFWILDAHSPHQLCAPPRKRGALLGWYFACSIDTPDAPLQPDDAIERCIAYARSNQVDNRSEAERQE